MADPTMVTDDLIRTRQAIFEQPDWLQACEMNMALQDPEIRRRNMLTDDDLRSIQAPALVLWTTKDPSGPVDEAKRHRLADPERPARGHGELRSLAAVRGHRDLQPASTSTSCSTAPTRPIREIRVVSADDARAAGHEPQPAAGTRRTRRGRVRRSSRTRSPRPAGSCTTFDPDVIVNFAPDHYNGFFYRLMPPFCIGYAAESIGDYGSQAGRLDVPEDLARALAEAVIGDGIDLAVSLDMQVDHGAVQPMEILYGDIAAKPFVPIFINSVAPPFTPIAADPAARRGHRPPPRDAGQQGPAHRLRRPVARPARAAAGHRHPRSATHADGGRRPALAGSPRRPPAAGHRRRPRLRRRHRRRSRTSRRSGTAD